MQDGNKKKNLAMARLSDAFHSRCPYCQSVFKVRQEHLSIADGRVRCGNCFGVFLATEHLAHSAPARHEPVPTRLPPLPAPTEAPVFNELGEDYEAYSPHEPYFAEAAPADPPPSPPTVSSPLGTALSGPAPTECAEETYWAHDPASYALPARDLGAERFPAETPDEDERAPRRPIIHARDWEDDAHELAEPDTSGPNWRLDPDERRFDDHRGLDEVRDEPMAITPARHEFDPDDPDFEIDETLLDDTVLGPLEAEDQAFLEEYAPDYAHFSDEEPTINEALPLTEEHTADEDEKIGDWDEGDEVQDQAPSQETDEAEPATVEEPGEEAWTARSGTLASEELEQALEAPPESPVRLFLWGLGSLLLLALFAGQALWSYRDRLAQSPEWRPYIEQFCATLRCEIQPLRDVARIALTSRALQPNPALAGAYDVHLILVNQASFDQPYPEIELAFTNLDGQHLARRRFQPAEYLAAETRGQLMPAGVPVHVRFAIVAPDPSATGFEFRFH